MTSPEQAGSNGSEERIYYAFEEFMELPNVSPDTAARLQRLGEAYGPDQVQISTTRPASLDEAPELTIHIRDVDEAEQRNLAL